MDWEVRVFGDRIKESLPTDRNCQTYIRARRVGVVLLPGGIGGAAVSAAGWVSTAERAAGTILLMAMPEAPTEIDQPTGSEVTDPALPWLVIVWNDPINLMSYVAFVFQKLFGFSAEKANRLMLQVHNEGRSIVSSGPREKAEFDTARLHAHGLWATMQRDG